MRAAAPIEVTVKSSAAWETGVAVLCGIGLAGIGAWADAGRDQHGLFWLIAAAAASGVIALAAVRPLLDAPSRLRWDGAAWRLASGASHPAGDEPGPAGRLQVMIDLGDWMLVRFVDGSGWRRRVRWLALQRSADPAQWHALRCAVFAPPRQPGST